MWRIHLGSVLESSKFCMIQQRRSYVTLITLEMLQISKKGNLVVQLSIWLRKYWQVEKEIYLIPLVISYRPIQHTTSWTDNDIQIIAHSKSPYFLKNYSCVKKFNPTLFSLYENSHMKRTVHVELCIENILRSSMTESQIRYIHKHQRTS